MPAISMDLRTRIVAAYDRGEGTYQELATRFDVGYATVSRLLMRARQGRLPPSKPGGGNPPRISKDEYESLRSLVEEMPSATRAELAAEWEKRFGKSVSVASMGRALHAAGLTFKKRAFVPKNSSALTLSKSERHSKRG